MSIKNNGCETVVNEGFKSCGEDSKTFLVDKRGFEKNDGETFGLDCGILVVCDGNPLVFEYSRKCVMNDSSAFVWDGSSHCALGDEGISWLADNKVILVSHNRSVIISLNDCALLLKNTSSTDLKDWIRGFDESKKKKVLSVFLDCKKERFSVKLTTELLLLKTKLDWDVILVEEKPTRKLEEEVEDCKIYCGNNVFEVIMEIVVAVK